MSRKNLSVLIAEDHPVNRKVLGLLLDSLDVPFDCAKNGAEAIEAAAKNTYRLILMDCMMPEVDGFQAAFEIRKQEFDQNKYTPIIACTAMDKDRCLERCIRSGMNDHIVKPISKELLRRKLAFWSVAFKSIHQISATVSEEIARLESSNQDEPINRIYLDLLYGVQQLEEVLQLFLTVTETLLTGLKSAIANRDMVVVRILAHEIKGSSYAVNAREMARICRELERAGEEENWAEAEQLNQTLEQAFSRVRKFLHGKELIT
ncbi:MAG: response regulator [Candidatus Obscuribacterales bacterium]|jgi:CheY-like chemotaxis protein|nr:response regulator [Candidatus Obscuribacterales bacterium]